MVQLYHNRNVNKNSLLFKVDYTSVKKEIYEKESAYKKDHWLWHALHDVTCIMEKDAYKL